MPHLVILGAVALSGLALLFTGGSVSASSEEEKARKLGKRATLVWHPEKIRVAACAAWNLGTAFWQPEVMAQTIGNEVYPSYQWPPPTDAQAAQHKLWARLVSHSADVVLRPHLYCAGEE